jgi:uncharacterized protein DUF4255
LSKLWSAFQAHYRPTAAYQVSVVLIEASQPARSPLPVLSRGPVVPSLFNPTVQRESGVVVQPDAMPPFPEIETVELPNAQIVAHLGDTVVFAGHHLDGSNHRLLLSLPRLHLDLVVTPASTITASTVSFALPNLPTDFPAGTYLVAVEVVRPGESSPRVSNQVTLTIAPQMTTLTSPPQIFTRDADGTATVAIGCTPDVRPTQRASVIVGSLEVLADPHPSVATVLTFTILNAPVGTHFVRLRVDGADSQLVDRSATPAVFFDHRIQIV